MTNQKLCTLLVAILFNVQSILGRSMTLWDQRDKPGAEKTTNAHWVVKLKLVIPDLISRCNGILVETPKTKELGLSDTILMNPGCFGLDYVRRILIHPKFNYGHDGYELAVVRLASPVKVSDNLKPAVLSHLPLAEVNECSLTGWTREFNFSIHSDEMLSADNDRNEYLRFLVRSSVALPGVEVGDENSTIIANIPSLPPNKCHFRGL
uniref:Peptidase S1 domain-containing protein n=1 Tax=Romanomermis culicivorax TaxID=13658 RepID=A0A915KKJ0_ROMCU